MILDVANKEIIADKDKLVVVAMSGGVDSSAAALILAEQGYSVIGVSMQVWDYRKNGGNSSRATCCAPADFDDARKVAAYQGFPFYVFDFEDSFYQGVISPFVQSYLEGYTPNPCLDCNRKVKFRELRSRARSFGATKVATGHYAQIKELADGSLGLFTSEDQAKDQSYFLYALTQQDLQQTLFPVGGMTKPEVRAFLDQRGLAVATKAESQDICFVSSSVGEFVERESKKKLANGEIVNSQGEKLGQHQGIHNFTIGQRRGLGVSSSNPLYVIQIDPQANKVVLGEKEDLARETFFVRDVNWVSGEKPSEKTRAKVKLRYRHQGVLCEIEALGENRAKLSFVDEWSSVSPGQAAVFYGEELKDGVRQIFGGGIIMRDDQVEFE